MHGETQKEKEGAKRERERAVRADSTYPVRISCASPGPVRRERITPLAGSNWTTGCGGQASFDSVTLARPADGVNRVSCFECLW